MMCSPIGLLSTTTIKYLLGFFSYVPCKLFTFYCVYKINHNDQSPALQIHFLACRLRIVNRKSYVCACFVYKKVPSEVQPHTVETITYLMMSYEYSIDSDE